MNAKKTNVERVKAALEAAGAKGLTLDGLIDEVNVVNGAKVPQDEYMARGPVMAALAEIPDQWEVIGDGSGALYKLKAQVSDAPKTSAELQSPDEALATRVAMVSKIATGEHHAWKGTADQEALVRSGIAEVFTAEGGAQSIVLAKGAVDRIIVAGACAFLRPTVPVVELGEPREDALVRRAKFVERIHGGEVITAPAEFTADMRELINKGVVVLHDAEGGAQFALTDGAKERLPQIGFRGLAEESLPPPAPVAPPAPPVDTTPEYKALEQKLKTTKDELASSRAVERAIRKKLEEVVPTLKPRTKFTYKYQWTVDASNPMSSLAMQGRGLELSKLLEREVKRHESIAAAAKARHDEVKKNLGPRIQELRDLDGRMTWEEQVVNCTAQIIGQFVYVRDEYENCIAKFTATACPEYILTAAERVEEKPADTKKKDAPKAADAPAAEAKVAETPPTNAEKSDGKGGEGAADGEGDKSGESASAGAKPLSFPLSVEGFQSGILTILDEHGYVIEDELPQKLGDACGNPIPETAKAFMVAAVDQLKKQGQIKEDRLDDRSVLMRVGEPKVAGKTVTSSGGKVSAAVLKKVIGACKRLAGDKANATIKLQEIVDASTCSANEVELAMAKAVDKGDATAKSGRGKAWIWKGESK